MRKGDHPRSRGVYACERDGMILACGSSPLARGLPEPLGRTRYPGRIIPARAGFTAGSRGNHEGARDHPRSRGVYRALAGEPAKASGSSPLARGLHRDEPWENLDARIIPARAGFTPRSSEERPRREDHPRSRGVYLKASYVENGVAGSSPLARGLQHLDLDPRRDLGIIPARAGFTRRWSRN